MSTNSGGGFDFGKALRPVKQDGDKTAAEKFPALRGGNVPVKKKSSRKHAIPNIGPRKKSSRKQAIPNIGPKKKTSRKRAIPTTQVGALRKPLASDGVHTGVALYEKGEGQPTGEVPILAFYRKLMYDRNVRIDTDAQSLMQDLLKSAEIEANEIEQLRLLNQFATGEGFDVNLIPSFREIAEFPEVAEARVAVAVMGVAPKALSGGGASGTYLMRDRGDQTYVGVFKPRDEEPFMPNAKSGATGTRGHVELAFPADPVQYVPAPGEVDRFFNERRGFLKFGVPAGRQADREVAAYVLDHERFAGTIPAAIARFRHDRFNKRDPSTMGAFKEGAFIKFQAGATGEINPDWRAKNGYDARAMFPAGEVHKIALLYARLGQADHWEAFHYDTTALVPLDHGLVLTDGFMIGGGTHWPMLDECCFTWCDWPQMLLPLDSAAKEYVARLDPQTDEKLLKSMGFPQTVVNEVYLRTVFLKLAVEAGLLLYDVGDLMYNATNTYAHRLMRKKEGRPNFLYEESSPRDLHLAMVDMNKVQMNRRAPLTQPAIRAFERTARTVISQRKSELKGLWKTPAARFSKEFVETLKREG